MGEYTKPWLTFDKQASLLIDERGLVADRDNLVSHLADVGYYRLSGYWFIFKRKPVADEDGEKDERFQSGTTFDQVWHLYTFDRQLRLVVLDAIERVEVYFRTQLAYELARTTGAFGFTNRENLPRLKDSEYEEFSIDASRSSAVLASHSQYISGKRMAIRISFRPIGYS